MSPIHRLLQQLHHRSVWQVFVTYVGLSWLVLEVAEHLIGQWGLPAQAYAIALLCLLVGLPFVIATAWIQDEPWQKRGDGDGSTPESGAQGASSSSGSEPATPGSPATTGRAAASEDAAPWRPSELFTWRNAALGSLGALGLWIFSSIGWAVRRDDGVEQGALAFALNWPSVERDYHASVFVSMVRDLSSSRDHAHLAEGITEELIHELSHLEGLRVSSFTSADALRGSALRPPEIAEMLDVGHLLEGTLASQGDSIRVIVQLIDAERDAHEWSIGFMGAVDDVFAFRQRIAAVVSDSLALHLSLRGHRSDTDRVAESPAHEAYLRGSKALARRTSLGVQQAIVAFDEALALDSAFAPARAGLASAYALSITYRTRLPVNAYSAAGYAWRLATRAIEDAPDLAAGHSARGYVASLSFAPTPVVLADFRRAMELEPDAPQVPGWYAHLLVREGRIDEALAAAKRSSELSPLAPGRRLGVAFAALQAHDYELAAREAHEAWTLEPGIDLARALEARALLLSGRAEECLDLELGPYIGTRALCLHDVGREEDANRLVADLRRRVESGDDTDTEYSIVLSMEDLAVFYAWTERADLSLEWLERTFNLSPCGVDSRIVESGLFDPVLEAPGFREDLQRLREGAWRRVARLANADQIDLSGSERAASE